MIEYARENDMRVSVSQETGDAVLEVRFSGLWRPLPMLKVKAVENSRDDPLYFVVKAELSCSGQVYLAAPEPEQLFPFEVDRRDASRPKTAEAIIKPADLMDTPSAILSRTDNLEPVRRSKA